MPALRKLLTLGAIVAALGCTSTPPTPSPNESVPATAVTSVSPPSTTAAPTATAVPSVAPSATAPVVGQAWQSVLDSIGDDGTISKDTALQAFSVAIGPLPGVSVPPGEAGFVGSGTMAV